MTSSNLVTSRRDVAPANGVARRRPAETKQTIGYLVSRGLAKAGTRASNDS